MPSYYVTHLRNLTLIYLCTLPFALMSMGPLSMIFAVFVLAFGFLGTEEISYMCENPFQNESGCDVPVDDKCREIQFEAWKTLDWKKKRDSNNRNSKLEAIPEGPPRQHSMVSYYPNSGALTLRSTS